VEELYRFRDRLPENCVIWPMRHSSDPEGNKTMVRFSRKPNSNMSLRKKTERRLVSIYVDGKMG
jgi:DNA topoisomerase-1